MTSIRQNPGGSLLPDFSNLGVWLRILLLANLLALIAAFAGNSQLARFPAELAQLAAAVEPPLILGLLLLRSLQYPLTKLPYAVGVGAVFVVALASALLWQAFGIEMEGGVFPMEGLARNLTWTVLCTGALLLYFYLSHRLRSPALAEARLMALSARIRPHFLFNALNAVLGVIRSDPKRAEQALEELADLFRVLMRDNRELVRLSDEIALARQYLDLERLRLGDRLQVKWDIESCPPDALMPPLMIQPLLENAVYHGIEPSGQPGEITIGFARRDKQLLIEMCNPFVAGAERHSGNQMALANIRERLMLFFDLEARLETSIDPESGRYVVRISIPYRLGAPR